MSVSLRFVFINGNILFSEANIQNLSPNRHYNTDDCPSCNRSFNMIRSISLDRRHLSHLTEDRASGVSNRHMMNDCKTYGLTDLIWKEDGDHLILEFPGLGIGEGVRDGVNDIVIEV